MVKRVDSLTDAQKVRMPEWVEKWTKVGHCTDPADWDIFERAAEKCYAFAGIPWHGKVVRAGSPIAGAYAVFLLGGGSKKKVPAALKAEVNRIVEEVGDFQVSADAWTEHLGGQFWVSWSAHTSFFRDVCNLELPGDLWDRDQAYADAQSSVGWWWPFRDFIVVSDRPEALHVEQFRPGQWRMHCETGPAIAYRDGAKLYFLEGIEVPAYVVEDPSKITLKEIRSERNAELRRILTQQYGLLRYFRDMDMKPLDSRFGEVLFHDKETSWRWLVCTDGSTGRIYQLRVPTTCNTVIEAQRSLSGVDPELLLPRS